MENIRVGKVVSMEKAMAAQGQPLEPLVPQVVQKAREEEVVQHVHRHTWVPWHAIDPRGYRDFWEGQLAKTRVIDLRIKWGFMLVKFVTVCAFAAPLVICGSIALLRYASATPLR